MGLGWGQLAGAIGKIIGKMTDSEEKSYRKIAKKREEIAKLVAKEETADRRERLAGLLNELERLRREHEREVSKGR